MSDRVVSVGMFMGHMVPGPIIDFINKIQEENIAGAEARASLEEQLEQARRGAITERGLQLQAFPEVMAKTLGLPKDADFFDITEAARKLAGKVGGLGLDLAEVEAMEFGARDRAEEAEGLVEQHDKHWREVVEAAAFLGPLPAGEAPPTYLVRVLGIAGQRIKDLESAVKKKGDQAQAHARIALALRDTVRRQAGQLAVAEVGLELDPEAAAAWRAMVVTEPPSTLTGIGASILNVLLAKKG
jgi:hypothetical protein